MSGRIGIFLAYAPEQPLAEHGLGRQLAMLVRGFVARGDDVVLAMPHWLRADVEGLLAEFEVAAGDVEWLTTDSDPVLLRLRRALLRREKRGELLVPRLLRGLRRARRIVAERASEALLSGLASSSVARFLLTLSAAGLLAVALPLWLAWTFPRTVAVVAVAATLAGLAARLLESRLRGARHWLRDHAGRVVAPLKEFKGLGMARRLYGRMRAQELRRLVDLINGRANVDAWLVPTLFWPEAGGIRAAKTVVVPDLVMIDAPVMFASHVSTESFEQLRDTLGCADRLICYSEHVKEMHIVRRFGVAADQVRVIAHAPVDLMATFRKPAHAAFPVRRSAAGLLREYLAAHPETRHQLRGVPLHEVDYLFYASQIRPHKNVLTLVRAYERLLRHELVNVKLVITGDLMAPEALREATFVWENRLQFDVISLPRVPADVLSALFACARLAVCPTLFEGGLPFTFSEALSVGTPVVMSRIPVVTERLRDEALNRIMLFDPYDAEDMCARMHWALAHREELLARQLPVFRSMAERRWEHVAGEYAETVLGAGARRTAG